MGLLDAKFGHNHMDLRGESCMFEGLFRTVDGAAINGDEDLARLSRLSYGLYMAADSGEAK